MTLTEERRSELIARAIYVNSGRKAYQTDKSDSEVIFDEYLEALTPSQLRNFIREKVKGNESLIEEILNKTQKKNPGRKKGENLELRLRYFEAYLKWCQEDQKKENWFNFQLYQRKSPPEKPLQPFKARSSYSDTKIAFLASQIRKSA